MSIEIRNVSKHFGDYAALDGISLDIPEGELVALLGPSGCGKTTLLRIIAGLEQPDGGSIAIHGEDKTAEHVRNRGIGFVFQHYALFRHMTVFENVAFGLRARPRRRRPGPAAIRAKVTQLLELVQLGWLAERYPDQLSGGQRQRIALARALAVEPRVLLLDEPFGALDANVRKDLRRWLRDLHRNLDVTSVFVTHDQEEAMEVASRVVVMNKSRIEQAGSPAGVYDNPATPFVSRFIGSVNIFRGRAREDGIDLGHWRLPMQAPAGLEPVSAFVRPHDIQLTRRPEAGLPAVEVEHVLPLGAVVRLEVRIPQHACDAPIHVEIPRRDYDALEIGKDGPLFLRVLEGRVFPVATNAAEAFTTPGTAA
jgi:sulfate transport system ATP-binding protein